MEDVLKRVEAAGLADRVRFGLVAYRDDPDKVANMEYLTRTFADPNLIKGAEDFTLAVEPLAASKASTRDFAEDGFAGIDAAFKTIDWSDFGARLIILITDASSREGNSKFSSTGLNTPEAAQLIRANKAALYTLYLKTPVGKDDHAKGEAQYQELSRFPGVGSLYYPVEAGDPEKFAAAVERLANALWRRSPRRRRPWPRPTRRHRSRPSPRSRRSRRVPPWSGGRWRWRIWAGRRMSRRRRCSRPGRRTATSLIRTSRPSPSGRS